jgi:FKBP-type peptidyl-prolyl cis-trans isomerase
MLGDSQAVYPEILCNSENPMIKKTFFIVLMALAAAGICAAGGGKEAAAPAPAGENTGADADTSYAVGMWVGMSIRQQGMLYDFNYAEFLAGFRDMFEGREPRLSEEEAISLMQSAQEELQARISDENRQQGETFLAENSKREGVLSTASGLQYEVLTQGGGTRPIADDTVEINYEVSLLDGTVLESSFGMDETVEIPLGNVIPGFTEGIQLMPVGSTYVLYLPPALAYGERGGGGIPPNATLIFKIELLSILE